MKSSRLLQNFRHYEIPFQARIAQLQSAGKEIVSFSGGDAALLGYVPPEYARSALINAAEKNLTVYPSSAKDVISAFRGAAVEREKKIHGVSYDPSDVTWTNGVTHAHQLIYFSLLNPEDECIILEPTYHSWLEYAYVYPHKLVPVRGGVEENEWRVEPDDIRTKITDKTKVIILVNPNNPTGAVWDEKTVKEIVDIAGEHSVLLISDEIYDLTVFDGLKSVPVASLARDVPVITLNGLTKNWLLQGWRVGYMLFHDPQGQIQDYKKRLMDFLDYSLLLPTPILAAAAQVLKTSLEEGAMDHLHAVNEKLEKQRDYLWKRMNEIEGVRCVKPHSGYFSFPLIEGVGKIWKDEGEFVLDLLEEGVYLRPGFLFGSVYGRRHVRATFLLSVDAMRKGLDIWQTFMKKRVR